MVWNVKFEPKIFIRQYMISFIFSIRSLSKINKKIFVRKKYIIKESMTTQL